MYYYIVMPNNKNGDIPNKAIQEIRQIKPEADFNFVTD